MCVVIVAYYCYDTFNNNMSHSLDVPRMSSKDAASKTAQCRKKVTVAWV